MVMRFALLMAVIFVGWLPIGLNTAVAQEISLRKHLVGMDRSVQGTESVSVSYSPNSSSELSLLKGLYAMTIDRKCGWSGRGVAIAEPEIAASRYAGVRTLEMSTQIRSVLEDIISNLGVAQSAFGNVIQLGKIQKAFQINASAASSAAERFDFLIMAKLLAEADGASLGVTILSSNLRCQRTLTIPVEVDVLSFGAHQANSFVRSASQVLGAKSDQISFMSQNLEVGSAIRFGVVPALSAGWVACAVVDRNFEGYLLSTFKRDVGSAWPNGLGDLHLSVSSSQKFWVLCGRFDVNEPDLNDYAITLFRAQFDGDAFSPALALNSKDIVGLLAPAEQYQIIEIN